MTSMDIVDKDGVAISSVAAWSTLAPPKGGDSHWVAGRSAHELATAWCGSAGPCVPHEIDQLLRSHPHLADLSIERAFPSARFASTRCAANRETPILQFRPAIDLGSWRSPSRARPTRASIDPCARPQISNPADCR